MREKQHFQEQRRRSTILGKGEKICRAYGTKLRLFLCTWKQLTLKARQRHALVAFEESLFMCCTGGTALMRMPSDVSPNSTFILKYKLIDLRNKGFGVMKGFILTSSLPQFKNPEMLRNMQKFFCFAFTYSQVLLQGSILGCYALW